ncbi:MAG: hypothetical protein AAFR96_05760 [Planctomycetota bacterium]
MNRPEVHLSPDAAGWARLVSFESDRHADERSRLGLPTDRPIVMAGHQGGLWHAGIAAKLIAARALADRIGGAAAWLVVDTTDEDPLSYRSPSRDASGIYTERSAQIDDPPGSDRDKADNSFDEHAAARHARIREAWHRQPTETDAHTRATLAAIDLLGEPEPIIIRASDLPRTGAFGAIVEAFRRDAAAIRSSYNNAAAMYPDAGIAPLAGDHLPLWRRTPSGARLPARDRDLEFETRPDLLPKALVTTGVARAGLCDAFVHGTGGVGYEPINDRWLAEIVGHGLAPFVTATATLRLRFEGDAVTREDAARAAWRAHHARHHPGVLGDADAEADRERIVARIEELPYLDPRRQKLYQELHAVIREARDRNADALGRMRSEADAFAARASEAALRSDRTWPAALHDPADLDALRLEIDRAFGP